MSNLEKEIADLREKNNELVQTVQYWKITAGQRENEKLELMKEINELRLKLSRIRSGGAAQVRQLDAALQAASQEALTHLVQASSAVARSIDLAKAYMRDRQELDTSSPRWSSISGTHTTERVNRVPPLLIGGQSIQPVVSLSRTFVNSSGTRSANRSPNQQSRNVAERAVPMRMLQDVYIPLTRIDAGERGNNMETDSEPNINDSTEDLGLEDDNEQVLEESQNISELDQYESSQRLEAVLEDTEPNEDQSPPPVDRIRVDNPLEGPSWLLDIQGSQTNKTKCRINLEPDSTTELDETAASPSAGPKQNEVEGATVTVAGCEFSPTVRRRKRTSSPRASYYSPHFSPRPTPRRNSTNGRVLKVLIAKMKLEDAEDGSSDVTIPKRPMRDISPRQSPKNKTPRQTTLQETPTMMEVDGAEEHVVKSRGRPKTKETTPKRMMRFDAPSPNGATDACVIVSETKPAPGGSGEPSGGEQSGLLKHNAGRTKTEPIRRDTRESARDTQEARRDTVHTRDSRRDTQDYRQDDISGDRYESRDSDSSTERIEGRTRRARKAVTYKEKPLNRKLRR
ncbi:uncharacterized protein [Battus philenor]|uniref:uncharacterized protein n=1 Tax=Battus philenor TaxID=42288 RepID=UPI0035CE93B3